MKFYRIENFIFCPVEEFIRNSTEVKNDRPFQEKQFQTLLFVVCYHFCSV